MIKQLLCLLAFAQLVIAGSYTIVEEGYNPEMNQVIYDGLEEFNMQFFQGKDPSMDVDLFTIYAKDEEGSVIGGLYGYTFECNKVDSSYLQVDVVWVKGSRRGEGIGTRLFKQAESLAKQKGCGSIQLFTWSYQGVDFYQKLGFEKVGFVSHWINEHDAVFFRKKLD